MSDRVICPRHDNGGVLSFHVLFIHRMPCAITQQCVYGLGFKQMRKLFVCKRFFCLFVLCFCCFFFSFLVVVLVCFTVVSVFISKLSSKF